MRNGNSLPRMHLLIVALVFSAACSKTSEKSNTKKPAATHKTLARRTTKSRAADASLPTMQDVEAALAQAKEPTGGKVLALVYAGGIRGEIEPCG